MPVDFSPLSERAFLRHSTPFQLLGRLLAAFSLLMFLSIGCIFVAPDLAGWKCFSDEECLGKLICQDEKCIRPCLDSRECKTGTCLNGFCRTIKDAGPGDGICIPKPEVCNGIDDDCDQQIDEGLRCVAEGEECDPNASQPVGCQQGLSCLTYYPDRPRICLSPCTQGQANSCKDSRFRCLPTPGQQWACLQANCAQVTDCIYHKTTQHECAHIGGQDKFCLPQYPSTGTLGFGTVCSPSQRLYCDLKANLGCWRQEGTSKGMCTVRCQTDTDCTQFPGQKTYCREFSPNIRNIKVCTFLCPTGSCPQGMTCNTSKQQCEVR